MSGDVYSASYDSKSRNLNFAKVFGYMFLGLLITGGVAFLAAFLFDKWLVNDYSGANNGITIILICSSVLLLILTFVMNFVAFKGDKSLVFPLILYTAVMGLLLSTFILYIDWRILGSAFLLTAGIFFIMSICSIFLNEKSANMIAFLGFGLFFGAGIVALFTFLFTIWMPTVNVGLFWALDFIVFGAIMLITVFDIYNIKKICENGEMSRNLSLYCAFKIYVDFIYIFIRLVYYLAIATRR